MEISFVPLFVLLAFVFIGIYFLPFIIAYKRRHTQRMPILIINIFLGWTFLGWVGSLAWAVSNNID